MKKRLIRRYGGLLMAGGLLFQGCPLNGDDVQLAAATSVELFLTDLIGTAITEWVGAAFDIE